MLKTSLRIAPLLSMLLPLAGLADGASIVRDQCAECHAVERPDYEALGPTERLMRKAAPLYFAGNKYREEWLLQQLQQPARINPAGYLPNASVVNTEAGDIPDDDSLQEHVSLSAQDAADVTEYLMTLRPYDDLLAQSNYQPGNVAMRMGMMDFRKFKGCDACHQDVAGTGGLSGPELHTVWQRLQPAYIASFLQQPTAWDPNSIMPVPQMNEQAIHKLVDYLKLIGEPK